VGLREIISTIVDTKQLNRRLLKGIRVENVLIILRMKEKSLFPSFFNGISQVFRRKLISRVADMQRGSCSFC